MIKPFIDPASVTPSSPTHTTGVQPAPPDTGWPSCSGRLNQLPGSPCSICGHITHNRWPDFRYSSLSRGYGHSGVL